MQLQLDSQEAWKNLPLEQSLGTTKTSFFDSPRQNRSRVMWKFFDLPQQQSKAEICCSIPGSKCQYWYSQIDDCLYKHKVGDSRQASRIELRKVKVSKNNELKTISLTYNEKEEILQCQSVEELLVFYDSIKQVSIQTDFRQQYALLGRLGKGKFGEVFRALHIKSQKHYAVKILSKKKLLEFQNDRTVILKEVSVLRNLNSNAIIRMYEVFEDQFNIFLVQELLLGSQRGSLDNYIREKKVFREIEIAKIMLILLRILAHLKSQRIIHRDVKPDNIIFRVKGELETLCLADFGLAEDFHEQNNFKFTRCGTPGFVAPEVLMDKKYDYKVDVFSAGVIMYILICGKNPFSGSSYDSLVSNNYNCQIDFHHERIGIYSNLSLELLQKLLHADPVQRISASEAINHPWFAKQLGDSEYFRILNCIQQSQLSDQAVTKSSNKAQNKTIPIKEQKLQQLPTLEDMIQLQQLCQQPMYGLTYCENNIMSQLDVFKYLFSHLPMIQNQLVVNQFQLDGSDKFRNN